MRSALEIGCLSSLLPARSLTSLDDPHRLPALRPLHKLQVETESSVAFFGHVASRRSLHTHSHLATATMMHAHSEALITACGSRRPRCLATVTRLFSPPSSASRRAADLLHHSNRGSSDAPSRRTGKEAAAPKQVQPAVSLSSRLRRSHVLPACPLLYTVTLSSLVGEALASTSPGVLAVAERQLALVAADINGITKSTTSGAVSADTSSWSCVTLPFAQLLCDAVQRREAVVSEAMFARYLTQLVASTDAAMETAVAATVRALLAHWSTRPVQPSASHVEATVRSVVESASDVLLPAVVSALQVVRPSLPVRTSPPLHAGSTSPSSAPSRAMWEAPLWRHGSQTADDLRGALRWHPCLTEAAVKACLHRIAQLLGTVAAAGEKRKASEPSVLSPALRHRLQRCCLCMLPPRCDDRSRHDCAVLTMAALKNAAFSDLVAVYNYFVEEGLSSVPIAVRFLTNCGMCVPSVMQHGVSLCLYASAGVAPATRLTESNLRSFIAPRAALAPLLHARATLLESGRELKQIEGGLVHVNAVLNALGYAADVRAFYARVLPQHVAALSELRETPHSVMSLVRLHNVDGAVAALAELGASRPEGWVFVPPAVVQCMEAVSRLVGQAGSPAVVDALYVALIGFHNGSLFTSHYVELVLAGVCDRVRDVQHGGMARTVAAASVRHNHHRTASSSSVTSRATPHEVLERVIPVVRATLRYVGDELNADMILELVETALHVDDYAVSLTAALVWAFRSWMELSLCLQELLCRVDASTHNVPFLHFYALCYARDFCRSDTFDHLAALWHVDGDAIWNRAAHLSPSCQLWKCASCGRLNSDRYNYCLCSALRYSHVVCGTCGYTQDERLRQCRCCGTPLLTKAALSGAIARKAWQCSDCGARNAAKQTLLCFRCGHATGPRFRDVRGGSGGEAKAALKGFCNCNASSATTAGASHHQRSEAAYIAAVGVCRSCGRFKMDYAAHHSAVWVCVGCSQRRSTLERLCPSCPQVECLPHAVCRDPIEVCRVCRHCHHEEANAFVVTCTACGSCDDPFRSETPTAATAAAAAVVPSATSPLESSHSASELPPVLYWCFHCQHVQPWQDGVSLLHACCDSCGSPFEERGRCALPARACTHCGKELPARHGGTAACPHCATYVAPPLQPARRHTTPVGASADGIDGGADALPSVVWNAVTLLHTCEVVDGFCAREARLADTALNASAVALVNAEAQDSFLARRPTLERTLTRLAQEWTSASDDAPGAAVWLPLRMDVATVLGRALNRLRQHISFSVTARRLSGLLKGILTHVDALCGVAATGCRDVEVGRYNADTHFTKEELCRSCLGTHPAELCPFREDGGRWTCAECDFVNDNSDVGRYVCAGCLALRPVVQDLLVSTCWECHGCHRANVEFERYCVHCGLEREAWRPEMLTVLAAEKDEAANAAEHEGEEPMRLSSAFRADELPFTPAKCHLCGLVYIEARCPLCQNHIPDVADAKGVVCEVHARHAFIQPVGTTRPQDRIFVEEALLLATPLREGLEVHYTAELGARGRMKATFLRP